MSRTGTGQGKAGKATHRELIKTTDAYLSGRDDGLARNAAAPEGDIDEAEGGRTGGSLSTTDLERGFADIRSAMDYAMRQGGRPSAMSTGERGRDDRNSRRLSVEVMPEMLSAGMRACCACDDDERWIRRSANVRRRAGSSSSRTGLDEWSPWCRDGRWANKKEGRDGSGRWMAVTEMDRDDERRRRIGGWRARPVG